MRLDKYLKVSRIIKRRTVANEACAGGRVTLNGKVAKPGAEVKPGDEMVIRFGDRYGRYEILSVVEHVRKEGATECTACSPKMRKSRGNETEEVRLWPGMRLYWPEAAAAAWVQHATRCFFPWMANPSFAGR